MQCPVAMLRGEMSAWPNMEFEFDVLLTASGHPLQKHVAVLERAGLVTKVRIGRRKVVRINVEALLVVRQLLDQYEELCAARYRDACTTRRWSVRSTLTRPDPHGQADTSFS